MATEAQNFKNIDVHSAFLENAGVLTISERGLEFRDEVVADWFLVVFPFSDAFMSEVEVEIDYSISDNTTLYVNEAGGHDVLMVSSGVVLGGASAASAVVTDRLAERCVRFSYFCSHPTLRIGFYNGGGVFWGTGDARLIIHNVRYTVVSRTDDRIVLVDVGARGGVQGAWAPLANRLHLVCFEPDREAAAALRQDVGVAKIDVFDCALWQESGNLPLYITKNLGCTSLLKPMPNVLSQFAIADWFKVERTADVDCRRFDEVAKDSGLTAIDAIKIDVQGAELAVLKGFGNYLDNCLGIELEAHFYPIYAGQAIIGDLCAFLAEKGLWLRRLEPQMAFDECLIEVNAFFTRRRPGLTPEQLRKLSVIERVWSLQTS